LRLSNRVLAGAFLLSALATLLFYFFREHAPEHPVLLITTPAPQVELLPVYFGIALGYFDAAGLDLRVVYAGSREASRQKQPALNACYLEDVLYTQIFSQEKRVVVTILTEREGAVLLGRRPEAFSWEKTRQKSIIADEPTNATTVILEEILRKNKIYPHRETTLIQNIPEDLRIPAFLAGTGDYLVAPEPAATLLTQKRQAFVVAPLTLGFPLPRAVLAAPEEEARKNRAAITALNRVLANTRNDLYTRPAKELAWAVGPYFPHLSLSTLEKVIARGQKEQVWSRTGKTDPVYFSRLQEMLKRAGELPRPVACEEVFWGQKLKARMQN